MEMCYEGALAMPSSYVVMKEEEMTYVEGGWCIERKWWGVNIYLTHKERQLLTDGQAVVGVILAAMSVGIGGVAVGGLGTIIWNHDDGYGTKIRMTNMGKTAIVTGVYSLTRSQEKP